MKKILIVDDSPTMRRMVGTTLQSPALTFEEASNGLEAIEILARGGVDLMILDLNMPDMHGIDVLKFVRSHARFQKTPILILTTKYDPETRSSALLAGASDYLTKPFDPSTLREHASRLLDAHD